MPDIQVTLIVFEQQVNSLNQYLAAQVTQRNHPATGAPIVEPVYPGGIPEFLQRQAGNLIAGICSQYPNEATSEIMQRRKALDEELQAAARPGIAKEEGKK